MTTEKEIIACITLMASTLRQEATKLMLEGFCLALADLATDELRVAVGRALCECKFMPAPAELRAFAGKKSRRPEAPYHRALPPMPGLKDWEAGADFGWPKRETPPLADNEAQAAPDWQGMANGLKGAS